MASVSRQRAPVPEEALTIGQHHAGKTSPSLPAGGWRMSMGMSCATHSCSLPFGLERLAIPGLPRYGLNSGVVVQLLPATPGEHRPSGYSPSSISPLFLKLLQKGRIGYRLLMALMWKRLIFWRDGNMQRINTKPSHSAKLWWQWKPCWRLSFWVKHFQKTNHQPVDSYP